MLLQLHGQTVHGHGHNKNELLSFATMPIHACSNLCVERWWGEINYILLYYILFYSKYVYYRRLILICRKNIDGAAILKFKDLAATCNYSIWCFIYSCYTDNTRTHSNAWCRRQSDSNNVEQRVNIDYCRSYVSEINVNTNVDHIPLGLKPMPCTSADLYKLGTIMILSFRICILQHDCVDIRSTGKEESLHGQLKLLPENLARQ